MERRTSQHHRKNDDSLKHALFTSGMNSQVSLPDTAAFKNKHCNGDWHENSDGPETDEFARGWSTRDNA
jgi:hypothetical protein